MAVALRIRDDTDVVRIIAALVESAEALERDGTGQDRNEARARVLLSNRLADELEVAARRGLVRSSQP